MTHPSSILAKHVRLNATLILALGLTGCGGAQSINPFDTGTRVASVEETAAKYMPDLPANPSGRCAAVVVSAFTTGGDASRAGEYRVVDANGREHTISWGYHAQSTTGAASADQLQSALAMTDHFVINVREETFDSQRHEHDLAQDGWVTENEVHKGGLVSPDLFVKATITEWSPNVEGGGAGLGGLFRKIPVLGGVRWKNHVSRVGLQLQIVDRRQQIVATIPVDVEAKSTDWKVGGIGAASGAILGGALSQYSNTTMEEAIAQAIRASVERIYTKIPRDYFRHAASSPQALTAAPRS